MADVEVDRDGGVVTVTLNRPARKNAVTATMWTTLADLFRELRRSTDTRVVVLTGAEGNFCSGADLDPGASQEGPAVHQIVRMRNVGEAVLGWHQLPMPTVAKVRGVCVGAGMNLALGSDLIVAADDARFSEIFARRGLSIDGGGSWVLPRLVGLHKAKELALLAEIVDAAEAQRLGIVNRVVAADELDAAVDEWVERLAAGPPIALSLTKTLLNSSMSVTLEQALDAEGAAQSTNFSTADTIEAIRAFLEKREPRFEGR